MATAASVILDAIDDAIKSFVDNGAARVISAGDQTVNYTTLADLVEARKHYERVNASSQVTTSKPFRQWGIRHREAD